jgi:hypothetical protein
VGAGGGEDSVFVQRAQEGASVCGGGAGAGQVLVRCDDTRVIAVMRHYLEGHARRVCRWELEERGCEAGEHGYAIWGRLLQVDRFMCRKWIGYLG